MSQILRTARLTPCKNERISGRPICSRAARARVPADGGGVRRRRLPGPRRSRRSFGMPPFTMVGLPDAERSREPRSRPQRHPQLGFRVSRPPHHRQPGARRRPQGGRVVRPADRARHSRRAGRRRAPRRRRSRAARRAVAGRLDPAGARRAADCGGRHARRAVGASCCHSNASEAAIVDGPDDLAGRRRSATPCAR